MRRRLSRKCKCRAIKIKPRFTFCRKVSLLLLLFPSITSQHVVSLNSEGQCPETHEMIVLLRGVWRELLFLLFGCSGSRVGSEWLTFVAPNPWPWAFPLVISSLFPILRHFSCWKEGRKVMDSSANWTHGMWLSSFSRSLTLELLFNDACYFPNLNRTLTLTAPRAPIIRFGNGLQVSPPLELKPLLREVKWSRPVQVICHRFVHIKCVTPRNVMAKECHAWPIIRSLYFAIRLLFVPTH